MIFGIGTDIVEITRIKKSIEKEDGFRELVFSDKEISYCEKGNINFDSYAGRFAAKEAFLKAFGTGWRGKLAFREIEITNDTLGKPGITLSGDTLKEFKDTAAGKIHLSISHASGQAVAFVIIEVD